MYVLMSVIGPEDVAMWMAIVLLLPSGRGVMHLLKELCHIMATPAFPLGLYSGGIGLLSSTHFVMWHQSGKILEM